jgi:hypothetical protein
LSEKAKKRKRVESPAFIFLKLRIEFLETEVAEKPIICQAAQKCPDARPPRS